MNSSVLGSFFGGLAILARDDVGGVPIRPLVLRGSGFVFGVMLLGLLQELGQCGHIQRARPSARQACCDFLEEPSIAVGIAKRGKRAIGGMPGRGSADTSAAVFQELRTRRSWVEHFTDINTAGDKIFPSRFNVGDDQVEALGRTWRRQMLSSSQTEPSTPSPKA